LFIWLGRRSSLLCQVLQERVSFQTHSLEISYYAYFPAGCFFLGETWTTRSSQNTLIENVMHKVIWFTFPEMLFISFEFEDVFCSATDTFTHISHETLVFFVISFDSS
jgi:hypothetical protein